MPSDYDVGHRKPPESARWKKGQSGNPTGRSKGTKNLKTNLQQAPDEIGILERFEARLRAKIEVLPIRWTGLAAN